MEISHETEAMIFLSIALGITALLGNVIAGLIWVGICFAFGLEGC